METVPRRGYRFIATLKVPEPAVVTVEPNRFFSASAKRGKVALAALALTLVLSVGVVAGFRWLRHAPPAQRENQATSLSSVPFTALPAPRPRPHSRRTGRASLSHGMVMAFRPNRDLTSTSKPSEAKLCCA